MDQISDVIIIGAGPAGLTAGLYCAQAGLRVVILERETMGGKIMDVERIDNYPGFAEGVAGAELGGQMALQASKYGAQIQFGKAERLELGAGSKRVRTDEAEHVGKAVIIAGGARPKKLGVPGEERKGVAYCAMCDGGQFAGKTVAVIGGGDAGITDALYMTRLASRVLVIEVTPCLNAISLLQEKARKEPKIQIMCGTTVQAILGGDHVEAVKVLTAATKETATVPVDGVLVRVGMEPETEYLRGVVPLDGLGRVLVNENMETTLPGIFAAGDIRHGSPMQVAAAVGDGTIAAISALRYLRQADT